MKCQFQAIEGLRDARGRRKFRCAHCGQLTPFTPHGPELIETNFDCPGQPRPQPKPRGPCLHRGPETRRQVCETCGGSIAIKLFACALHSECSIGKQLAGLACCATCPDYEAGGGTQPGVESGDEH